MYLRYPDCQILQETIGAYAYFCFILFYFAVVYDNLKRYKEKIKECDKMKVGNIVVSKAYDRE